MRTSGARLQRVPDARRPRALNHVSLCELRELDCNSAAYVRRVSQCEPREARLQARDGCRICRDHSTRLPLRTSGARLQPGKSLMLGTVPRVSLCEPRELDCKVHVREFK